MSSEPVNIGDDDAAPLWLGWYAGPRRADGQTNARVSLTRFSVGPSGSVDMSVSELARLVHTAGVMRWHPTPYAEGPVPATWRPSCDYCGGGHVVALVNERPSCAKCADEHADGTPVELSDECPGCDTCAPWRKPREHTVNQPSPCPVVGQCSKPCPTQGACDVVAARMAAHR